MKNLINKPLTEMQKTFSTLHVKNSFGEGGLTNTECAIKAGYAPESAYQRATELLNPRICPHVVKYIGEMKEDFRKKNNIDPDKHLGRLQHLGFEAEKHKMFGIAGQMEIARGKVAGYYIERKAILSNKSIDEMGLDELYERMRSIKKKYRHFEEDKKNEEKK